MGQSVEYFRRTAANENRATLVGEIRELQAELEYLACAVRVVDRDTGRSKPTLMELEVRNILKMRADRAAIFDKGLFGEPAWDMLLDLYAADLSGHPQSVSDVCTASGVAPGTALRWLQHLQQEGWIERSLDARDSRRVFLSLTDKSRAAMKRFFAHPE